MNQEHEPATQIRRGRLGAKAVVLTGATCLALSLATVAMAQTPSPTSTAPAPQTPNATGTAGAGGTATPATPAAQATQGTPAARTTAAATAGATSGATSGATGATTAAADPLTLRTRLTAKLAEHTLVAGNAMAALLNSRNAEYQAALATLNANSQDVTALVRSLFGAGTAQRFAPLWQRHIQLYVDYTNGVRANDQAARDRASQELLQFAEQVGSLLSSANASLPQADVTAMMQQHVTGTMRVIDAFAANNFGLAYSLAGADVRHMNMLAQRLTAGASAASAIPAGTLRSDLAMLLIENAALNANATGALLEQRIPEYQAIGNALRDNSAALSQLLGTVYGGNTYSSTVGLWGDQNQRLAAYAYALANQDAPTQAQARSNAQGFPQAWVNQLNAANAQLPFANINTFGAQVTGNALAIVDAQRAQNRAEEYRLRAQTNETLANLANSMAQSIGIQFPTQYGPTGQASQPQTQAQAVAASSAGAVGGTAGNEGAAGVGTGVGSGNSTTVLNPVTGGGLAAPAQQVTGTVTPTATAGTGAITGTVTPQATVLNPVTGSDLGAPALQVTGTVTPTATAGTGAITGTVTPQATVLNPVTGSDLGAPALQVTGTVTGTTAATATAVGAGAGAATATTDPTVLNPGTGADLSQTGETATEAQQAGGDAGQLILVIVVAVIAVALVVAMIGWSRRARVS